jgi:putative hemolysin
LTELEQVLRLRYEIFHCEFLGKPTTPGIDMDSYDVHCDHLLILDRDTGKVVGTYRLIGSCFSNSFYSASEFNIDPLLAQQGIKLELSRACIHPNYRNGAVIHLLWRGIVAYMRQINASFLFGCSSIKSMDPMRVAEILKYLKDGGMYEKDLAVVPIGEYAFDPPLPEVSQVSPETIKEMIPPLFQFYLRAGARVLGLPALDSKLECTDFLTMLKIPEVQKSYEKKYL